jgi:sialidase-1
MKITLFKAGENGYPNYRIPAILALPENRIIVFCAGRLLNNINHDSGKIPIVSRISTDGGKTFGPQSLVAGSGENTVGNPCPVFDRDTGILWLFLTGNDGNTNEQEIIHNNGKRRVLVMTSQDLGETWSPVVDMTDTLSRKNWTWYATGPGHGLQVKSGRIIIPCDHSVFPLEGNDVSRSYSSHMVYSDDHGKTWYIGGDLSPATDECSVAEAKEGLLYMTVRRTPGNGRRGFSTSDDGGLSWKMTEDTGFPDPACQASVIAGSKALGEGFYPLYLTNVSNTEERKNLTLRISYNGGKTWPHRQLVEEGFSAYSDLALLEGDRLACLYEAGGPEQKRYAQIDFMIMTLEKTEERSV